jgi:hypothetical protein
VARKGRHWKKKMQKLNFNKLHISTSSFRQCGLHKMSRSLRVALIGLAAMCMTVTAENPVLQNIISRLTALERENAEIKAKLNATEGALLMFADGRTQCPEGWAEPAHLKGRMMTTMPIDGKSGSTFHRPFEAGEEGRTPSHSHDVTLTDHGHSHENMVDDPGHRHEVKTFPTGTGELDCGKRHCSAAARNLNSTIDKTNIKVESLSAKSAVSVSIDANDDGEHYPLVYVLICQKEP